MEPPGAERVATQKIELTYADDSEQTFENLESLRDSLPGIKPAEVVDVLMSLGVPKALTIEGRRSSGFRVAAAGTEAFAAGVVATLKSRLSGGYDAARQASAAATRLRLVDWLLLSSIPLLPAGAVFYYLSYIKYSDAMGAILVGVLGLLPAIVISIPIVFMGLEKRTPPPFALVPEGKQFLDEGERRTGPIWRAKAWFERHPLLGFLAALLTGAVLGRAADLIQF
jgi:hypothetical protein